MAKSVSLCVLLHPTTHPPTPPTNCPRLPPHTAYTQDVDVQQHRDSQPALGVCKVGHHTPAALVPCLQLPTAVTAAGTSTARAVQCGVVGGNDGPAAAKPCYGCVTSGGTGTWGLKSAVGELGFWGGGGCGGAHTIHCRWLCDWGLTAEIMTLVPHDSPSCPCLRHPPLFTRLFPFITFTTPHISGQVFRLHWSGFSHPVLVSGPHGR